MRGSRAAQACGQPFMLRLRMQTSLASRDCVVLAAAEWGDCGSAKAPPPVSSLLLSPTACPCHLPLRREALDKQAAEEAEREQQRKLLRQAQEQQWQQRGGSVGPGEHYWGAPTTGELGWGQPAPADGEWGAPAGRQGGWGAHKHDGMADHGKELSWDDAPSQQGGWGAPAGPGSGRRGGYPAERGSGAHGSAAEASNWAAEHADNLDNGNAHSAGPWDSQASAEDSAWVQEAPGQHNSWDSAGGGQEGAPDWDDSSNAQWDAQPRQDNSTSSVGLADSTASNGEQPAWGGGHAAAVAQGGSAGPSQGAHREEAKGARPVDMSGSWQAEGEEEEEKEWGERVEEEGANNERLAASSEQVRPVSDSCRALPSPCAARRVAYCMRQKLEARKDRMSAHPQPFASACGSFGRPQGRCKPAQCAHPCHALQEGTEQHLGQASPLATSSTAYTAGVGATASLSSAPPTSRSDMPDHAGGGSSVSAASASLPSPGSSPRYLPPQRRAAQGQARPERLAQPLAATRAAHGMPPPGFTSVAGGSTPLKGLVGSALLPGVKQPPAAPQNPSTASQQAPQGQAFGSQVAAAPTALPPLPPHLAAKQPQQAAAMSVPGQYAAVPQVYHAGHAVLVLQQEQQTPLLNTPGHYSQPPAPVYIQTPPQAAFYQPAGQAPQWLHPGWNQQPVGGWLQTPQGWVWQAAGAAPAYQPAPHSLQPVQQGAPEQLLAGSPRAQQQAQQLVVMAHTEGSAPVALLDSQLQPQRNSHMPVAAAGQAGPAAGSH